MPQLGPAFLHRPLRGSDLSPLRSAGAWIGEGARLLAPRPLRDVGWRPVGERVHVGRDMTATVEGVIERSLFGEERLVAPQEKQPALPASIVLDPSLIFETRIDLPAEARSSLAKTVSLRLENISPIPPAEAIFAVSPVRKSAASRIAVDVAIIRKSTIVNAERLLEVRPIDRIVAEAKEGKAGYVFKDATTPDLNAGFRRAGALVFLWLSVLALATAIDRRVEGKAAALADYEAGLLQEIRDLRANRQALAELETLAPPAAAGSDIVRRFDETAAALADGSVLEALAYAGGEIHIAGLTPAAAGSQDASAPLIRSPSSFAAYDRFELRLPLREAGGESDEQ